MGKRKTGKKTTAPKLESRRRMELKREEAEIAELERKSKEVAPAKGSMDTTFKTFEALPLSGATQKGLRAAGFTDLTDIQRVAIPHALVRRDILGAAKTGSGKTLAFLVPTLERLFRERWSTEDGLGALILTPTRELALQIFEVLRKVGLAHGFSAGLVLGGKDFELEQSRIAGMNVLVSTPGRLRQHIEQTPGFDTAQLRVLVLDEADRILDMGFEDDVNAIVDAVPAPPQRQTMLFSATQTRKVRDLARLSLNRPQFLAVHDRADAATPDGLKQRWLSVPLHKKLSTVYSFVKTHPKAKIVIFVSSCKQARFLHELFRLMNPGVKVLALHGKIRQMKRMAVYYDFLDRPAVTMIATDIAARGLDFPAVDWVIQMDCPEDVPAYIHRAGRTARFAKGGNALLLLDPSEEGMLPLLKEKRVELRKTAINPKRIQDATPKVAGLVAGDPELKMMAQKAFVSYMRSVFLQPNKAVFDVTKLPAADFAKSLGLSSMPKVKFADGAQTHDDAREQRNVNYKLEKLREHVAKAKERKRAKREAAERRRRGETVDADDEKRGGGDAAASGAGGDSDSEEGSDSGSDSGSGSGGEGEAAAKTRAAMHASKKKGLLAGRRGAVELSDARAEVAFGDAPVAGAADAADGVDSDSGADGEAGGLLVLRSRTLPGDVEGSSEGEAGGRAAALEARRVEAELDAGRRPRRTKIGSDGAARGVVGTKTVFDDDGEAVAPFETTAGRDGATTAALSTLKDAMERRAAEVRAALEARKDEDKARERERVRSMHRRKRQREKEARRAADGDGAAEGVRLMVDSDSAEDRESGDDDSDGASDDDHAADAARACAGAGTESEGSSDDDSDSDSGGSDGDQSAKRRRTGRSLADTEALALAALGRRRRA